MIKNYGIYILKGLYKMPTNYDLYKEELDEIFDIIDKYPTSMYHILLAVKEAKPLFEYLGPDGLFIAAHNEIIRRGLDKE